KEKGGRAIVWGDIALIDGNINAQGSGDIAKTGGFVETSGHYLSIDSNAIVKTKEWLLDPDNVTIEAPSSSRGNASIDSEFPGGSGTKESPKTNGEQPTVLTNETISNYLKSGTWVMNITAKQNLTVNSSINIGDSSHLILHSEGKNNGGVKIKEDITSNGGNLTIQSGGWVDVHKNITLGTGTLNITAKGSIAFEGNGTEKARNASSAQITAQGTITNTGDQKQLRLNNVSINGTGIGLNFVSIQPNTSHRFDGELIISGRVHVNQTTPKNLSFWKVSDESYWNVSHLTVKEKSAFSFTKFALNNNHGRETSRYRKGGGVIFRSPTGHTNFTVKQGSVANFSFKAKNDTNHANQLPIQFNSNISVDGGGKVLFCITSNYSGRSVGIGMSSINVSDGSNLTFNSSIRGQEAFNISKDLTINATGSFFELGQYSDTFNGNGFNHDAIKSTHNISILGGNVTLGGQDSSSTITGNINISQAANVTLRAYNGNGRNKQLTLGNVSIEGNLSLIGASANINGNLSVKENAKFKGETQDNLNITGTFINNGDSKINISQGVVKLGNVTNDGDLNITTHAKHNQRSIIGGDIINKKGSLNITDSNKNAEIQIGGNISQKEGNLTISSDKINITNQITIKAGVDGKNSDSDATNNANLTIKTKELKLTQDLNISGFNKAEITAKDGSDLTIGNTNSADGTNAKKVTFNQVKDSKISAGDHNVTLNSKVETSGNTDNTGDGSGNNAGLTIAAKNVEVKNNITSNKTVNITASEKLTTKADATINATTGNVEVTAKTGDIKGEVKSNSGDVEITASGDTLNVSNVSGNAVTITADKGKLTTQASSSITSNNGQTTLTAKDGSIAGSINAANVTLNTTGTLTTVEGSNINAASGTLVINAKDAKLNGAASGDHTVVNATNASGSGSVTAVTSSNVNITGDLSTVNGLNIISKNGRNTVVLKGTEIEVKYIQPGVASVEEVIEAKRVLEKVKDLSDEERETLAKLGVSAVRFIEPNNTITVNTQNEFTTRPSSQVTISEGKACFSSGNGAAVCTNVADDGQQ
ncbi:TPA: beta strand repeat-containing protein, partial [Haemophilus influenzae]